MRIVQLVPSLTYGDAVGNDVLALYYLLKEFDAETKVYVQIVDTKRIDESIYAYLDELPMLAKDDVIFYHMASGSPEMIHAIQQQHCRRYVIYHNITPPEFFERYCESAVIATQQALTDLEQLRTIVSGCLADSEFNKNDLLKQSYNVPIAVLPIVVPFDDYAAEPSEEVLSQYTNDGYINILFVGRIAPNKKQEDIIKAFCYYKKYVNSKSRLFLVGNWKGQDAYFDRLQRYTSALEVEDVLFLGHISFREILAYYHLADVFLCMSEHEGFCVPLLEAMYFNIPILAYNSTAIPYTLGQSGLIFSNKEPAKVAYLIDQVVKDEELRKDMLEKQKQRLVYFSYEKIADMAKGFISGIVEGRGLPGGAVSTVQQATSSLQNVTLRRAERVQIKAELLSFEQVPIRRVESLLHTLLGRGYRELHCLCPFFAERLKCYLKRYFIS